MRLLVLALALIVIPGHAEEKKKPPPKKPAAAAHKKATPEQIRKFNQLQKKQAK